MLLPQHTLSSCNLIFYCFDTISCFHITERISVSSAVQKISCTSEGKCYSRNTCVTFVVQTNSIPEIRLVYKNASRIKFPNPYMDSSSVQNHNIY